MYILLCVRRMSIDKFLIPQPEHADELQRVLMMVVSAVVVSAVSREACQRIELSLTSESRLHTFGILFGLIYLRV